MMDGGGGAGILIFATALYFLPFLIAALRIHPQAGAIFALNLLLGWTVIGWVGALVWSFTAINRPQRKPSRIREIVSPSEKKCPMCAEMVKNDAKVCRFCGHHFDLQARVGAFDPKPSTDSPT